MQREKPQSMFRRHMGLPMPKHFVTLFETYSFAHVAAARDFPVNSELANELILLGGLGENSSTCTVGHTSILTFISYTICPQHAFPH